MPKYFEETGKGYVPKLKVPPVPSALKDLTTRELIEYFENKTDWIKMVNDTYNRDISLTNIPVVQREENNDIAADVYTEENNEIPDFTQEELMQEIDLLKKSSNCDSVTEYKQKISNGEIINFSHAQIELWEMLEGKLQDLEDGE